MVNRPVAADCGEPWATEARKMAETLAETFVHGTELIRQLGQEKAEIQQAETMLGAAAAEFSQDPAYR